MVDYGKPEYWDTRYASHPEPFDWLENYASLKPYIEEVASREAKILMLGCGNAQLSEEMYDDGFTQIDNIDISSIVIKQMKTLNTSRTSMHFITMDVRKLEFEDASYDLVIDKNTIDALLCGDQAFFNVALMTKEVQRVLKVGGYYMVISYGIPSSRLLHFKSQHLSFDVKEYKISEDGSIDKTHYIYMCKKLPDADKVCKEKWEAVEAHYKTSEISPEETKEIQNLD